MEPGKPFQAVRVQTFVWPKVPTADLVVEKVLLVVEKVFRDSSGRLRIERYEVGRIPAQPEMLRIGPEDFAGNEDAAFEVPSGIPPKFIWLDDPCSLKSYFIDPAKKTARFTRITPRNEVPMCQDEGRTKLAQQIADSSVLPSSMEVLGHRQFVGVDAYGERSTTYPSVQDRKTGQEPVFSAEHWCSPELGVELGRLQHDTKAHHDLKIVLKRIDRKEADPKLFTVPGDYQLREVNPDGTPVITEASDKKNP